MISEGFLVIERNNLPRHVAIIMDGNGRWARTRGLSRFFGHREGIKRVDEIVEAATQSDIKFLTLFAFSAENWQRPKKEIEMLMRSLNNFLKRRISNLVKNNLRLKIIGRKSLLPDYLVAKLKEAEKRTANNTGLTIVLALNYGARQEIIDAVKRMINDFSEKKLKTEDINEEKFSDYCYTKGIPDPDLLIRTSGELRISNFLLWQLSYAELYFVDKYWPDFHKEDLIKAIKEYQRRSRRFGRADAD